MPYAQHVHVKNTQQFTAKALVYFVKYELPSFCMKVREMYMQVVGCLFMFEAQKKTKQNDNEIISKPFTK